MEPERRQPLLRSLLRLSGDTRDAAIDRALTALRHHLGMDVAFVGHFNGGNEVFRAVQGEGERFGVRPGVSLPLDETYCQRLIAGAIPNVVADAQREPRVRDLPATVGGVGSYLGVPLRLPDGRLYGTLCCVSGGPRPDLTERDVRFVEALAEVLGEELERERERAVERAEIAAGPAQLPPEQRELADELRRGIVGDQLELHYQPKVDLRTGQLAGVEALVRWAHPQRGLVPPNEFVPLAEQTGLVSPLTVWTVERALADRRAWQEVGLHVKVAVNLSAHLLAEPDLPAVVADTLEANGVAPAALLLEVTETRLMADPGAALEALARLAAMGIELSIDDFGTGYSSLDYLRRLPVKELKIDRSFVAQMERNEHDALIVRSTIELAHALNKRVVAEGVEKASTVTLLDEFGCDQAQGFLWSRPLVASALEAWARERTTHAREVDGRRAVVHVGVGGNRFGEHAAYDTTRGLLRIRHPHEAVSRLVALVRRLGGEAVAAAEAPADALPLDLSLGQGPPLLPVAPSAAVRRQLERLLPPALEDARCVLDLLARGSDDRERDTPARAG